MLIPFVGDVLLSIGGVSLYDPDTISMSEVLQLIEQTRKEQEANEADSTSSTKKKIGSKVDLLLRFWRHQQQFSGLNHVMMPQASTIYKGAICSVCECVSV